MDNTSVIQVRLPSTLREASEKRAGEMGLSSVQEAIRLFLHGFVARKVGLGITNYETPDELVKLSTEAKSRFEEIEADLDQGINTTEFSDPKKALEWLTRPSK